MGGTVGCSQLNSTRVLFDIYDVCMTYETPSSYVDVEKRFELDVVQTVDRDDLAMAAANFAHAIDRTIAGGRYKSLALTAAEEALMWAMRGAMEWDD